LAPHFDENMPGECFDEGNTIMAEAVTISRSNTGWLQPLEQPALAWLVRRLPAWATPNQLTALGFAGALITAAGYAFSAWNPACLWIASIGLAVNWYGDSLDGSLARFRKIERPRFGYFLDNTIDVIEQFLFSVGIGISGIIRWDLSFLALAAFLMVSILSFVRAQVYGEFQIAYGGIGLTEMRVLFFILNVLVFFFPPRPLDAYGIPWTYPNVLSLAWTCLTLITFLLSWSSQLRQLAAEDPPRHR
jgi:phosphatidylglycerophosphate synthase